MKDETENHFKYLIAIEPLGLLYGSAGAFLSPENLVGRSGTKFPPSAVTLAGLFAASYTEQQSGDIAALRLAGPFWSFTDNLQNFCVPTPFHLLTKLQPDQDLDLGIQTGTVVQTLRWRPKIEIAEDLNQDEIEPDNRYSRWIDTEGKSPTGKFNKDTWLPIQEWASPRTVYTNPWEFLPHLHPRLQADQRHIVDPETGGGSLYLENAVQLNPNICLIYLSNEEIKSGWYRFGGEGHLAEVTAHKLETETKTLLKQSLGKTFALITPALWGSNRLSQRYPDAWQERIETMLTERPSAFRYRMGGKGKTKRLSRGRYAVPAGTVYVMEEEKPCWYDWQDIFPKEGYKLNIWGSGLALPLNSAIAATDDVAIAA
jgi:CRISPR-associated protein Cmr3